MLNTQKVLYILSDVTYVAELLPAKKEHTFAIQSFRQINGEFITEEEEFIPNNIDKLFSKLQSDTYRLILPDFLFTNTILEVKETSESKVKQYIKDTLLPKLGLSNESHEIAAFILTQYGGTTKIQLTALEREVLDAVTISAKKYDVKIEGISPLTWTLKSIISLEPSISVVQIGSMLYAAEHYIGVDQCTMTRSEEPGDVIETIKTLKGAQPSIQTVYLLTNSLVEEKIKDEVSSTLPVQQLSTLKEDGSQMPSYVKQIIESGMKTLDIPDFSVPSFALPKEPINKSVAASVSTEAADIKETAAEEPAEVIPAVMPPIKPKPLNVFDDEETAEDADEIPAKELPEETDTEADDETSELPTPSLPAVGGAAAGMASIATLPTAVEAQTDAPDSEDLLDDDDELLSDDLILPGKDDELATNLTNGHTKPVDDVSDLDDETALDDKIAQFANKSPQGATESLDSETEEESSLEPETKTLSTQPPLVLPSSKRPVIKNQAGGNFMRMMIVTLAVTALTVAIGVAIFLGINSLNASDSTDGELATPLTSPMPSPSPVAVSPSPTASPSSTVNRAETSVLVVNATTKAGYAGTTTRKLQAAKYQQVTARNARGEYEPGIYVLMATEDAGLISALSEDSDLELEFASGKTTEDPSNQYDVVIVLAE